MQKRLTAIIALLEKGNKGYTVDDILVKFNRQADGQSLFPFMQGIIGQLKRLNRIRTSETYAATLASFMKFRDGQDILLCEIDSDTMMLYEAWLKANGNCPNTTSFYMRILRAVYNPCRWKRNWNGTETPVQARLYRYRQDHETCSTIESRQAHQGI